MLNSICNKCVRLGVRSTGTENPVWTGCVYLETDFRKVLKQTLAELESLEMAANKTDEEMMADPENAEKEAAFDAAYKAEWGKAEEAVKLLVKMTSGQIDEKTAQAMINGKREEIKKLLA